MKKKLPALSPSQANVFDSIKSNIKDFKTFCVWSRSGFGRTTIVNQLQNSLQAKMIRMRDFIALQRGEHPLSFQDTFFKLLETFHEPGKVLIVDDFHLILKVGSECYSNPRNNYYDVIARAIVEFCDEKDAQIIFASNGSPPRPLRRTSFVSGIGELEPADYQHVTNLFGLKKIDVEEVHRFAPRLSFYQLSDAAQHCADLKKNSTDDFIAYLREKQLASNVELGEVEEIKLSDLVGADELIESLEANVAFPLENDAASQKYQLRPKRGVLLLGPPGTGKTTIGKALAHRLRGKFFLIDGTFISGTDHFYRSVSHIFEEAKANAPAVIFIDDSDVIFESGQEHGLYRYLLTMLDGLESESAGRVCVMLTAMDIRHIPPALIRSGRVELWLETKLPDQSARAILIEKLVANLDLDEVKLDIDELAIASEGCTPADLKRLINEAKTCYAWDESQGKPLKALTEYAIDSINGLKLLKQKYAESRAQSSGSENRPVWFDVATP